LTETLHIYLRVSSETQSADGFGLAVQKEWGENLCRVLGFTPKFHDEGAASSSNDSLEKRPVLLSLLDQMDREEIKHLYVYNTDRLSRNQQTWGLIRTKISTNKVLLYTGRDPNPIDTNDPIQNMLMGILSEFSQYDNTIRKMRLTSGKFQKIKNGGWMGGQPLLVTRTLMVS
jgi:site-specific DNA recombinase